MAAEEKSWRKEEAGRRNKEGTGNQEHWRRWEVGGGGARV